ncbi:Protein of uncharacterised function DUF262 [Mycoplasmopsis maculosa]|uniref:Protein of uncharacterized function DUF262 n=1 Tax=Mycoplasmopsis maculosa TaxID=114885 RepID=A0A449B3M2_9BACT|nr:DUF262 domain-containing protein [Mycoplasmopsis maculosa]VEU75201.1 Protein of uncharacterised function DUF262 [Mycoplasmopsis maculosa]
MSYSIELWEEKINELGFTDWNIGTNIYTYLKNSVLVWLDKIEENDYILINYKENENKSIIHKIYFKNKEEIVFYDSRNDFISSAASKQLLDVLKSFSIIIEDEEKMHINKELIELKNKKFETNTTILKEFITKNFYNLIEKNVLSKIKELKNNNQIENKENTKTKLWWNLIRSYCSSINDDDKLIGIFTFLKKFDNKINSFYNDFFETFLFDKNNSKSIYIKNIIDNNINKFLEETKSITELEDTNWEEKYKIDFNSIKNKLEYTDKIKEKNNDLDIEINKGSLPFLITKTKIYDFFTSRQLSYKMPLFQRTYSWDSNMIKGLFESLLNDFLNNNERKNYSLLNNIILGQNNINQIIIDGQQRITSLILIILSLKKLAMKMDENDNSGVQDYLNPLIAKIGDMIRSFTQSDENYKAINDIVNNQLIEEAGKKENIKFKNTRFFKNWKEIIRLVDKKIKYISFLKDFLKYLLENTYFIVTYMPNLDDKKAINIFSNLNKYSKKLGVLDLFRNKINEIFGIESEEYIKTYNETINLYFRNSISDSSKDENISLILNFLNNLLTINQYQIKIEEIDENYSDNISNAFEKIEEIIKIYNNNEFKFAKKYESFVGDLITYLWENIIEFEYCTYGSITEIIKIIKDKKIYNKTFSAIEQIANNFYEKIKKYSYVNFQIYHISNGGAKTVFIPLIWTLAKEFEIFDFSKKELNENKVKEFSKYLAEIEKFSALWKIKFSGQSLTLQIRKICLKLKNDDGNLISPEQLYLELEKTIKELTIMSNAQKINELYKDLQNKLNAQIDESNYKNKKDTINLLYKIVLAKVSYGILLRNHETPQYFTKFKSKEEKNNNTINYIDYTYEHSLPKKLKPEDKKRLDLIGVKEHEIENIVKQIGNGCLLSDSDNKSLKNNFRKNYNYLNINNYSVAGGKTNFNKINFDQTLLSNDELIWSNEQIELPKIISVEDNKYENFKSFSNYILNRSKEIIKAYISILFYDLKK